MTTQETNKKSSSFFGGPDQNAGQLQVVFSPEADMVGFTIPIESGSWTIGRSRSATIRLEGDQDLSRVHCTLNWEDKGELYVQDNNSRNGTFVNGKATLRQTYLGPEDVLTIGSTVLVRDSVPTREAHLGHPLIEEVHLGIIGASLHTAALRAAIQAIAPTRRNVLILGPTGSGKEVAAEALHQASGQNPFVPVNCATLTETLADSQLFGHQKGAFSGASSHHRGWIEEADGGILFLDELATLPTTVQPKLLRVLQTGTYTPLGGQQERTTQLRVIAATNEDLSNEGFRSDLYARLFHYELTIRPLSERRSDIIPLFRFFLAPAAPSLSPEFAEALVLYDWPYNVRDIQKLAIMYREQMTDIRLLTVADLPTNVRQNFYQRREHQSEAKPEGHPSAETLKELLIQHNGNVSSVARSLECHRNQVVRWLDKYRIKPDTYRRRKKD